MQTVLKQNFVAILEFIVTMRMLAGGSYLDQMSCWGIVRSMTFEVFREKMKAIGIVLQMPGLPLSNEEALNFSQWVSGI